MSPLGSEGVVGVVGVGGAGFPDMAFGDRRRGGGTLTDVENNWFTAKNNVTPTENHVTAPENHVTPPKKSRNCARKSRYCARNYVTPPENYLTEPESHVIPPENHVTPPEMKQERLEETECSGGWQRVDRGSKPTVLVFSNVQNRTADRSPALCFTVSLFPLKTIGLGHVSQV